MAVEAARAEVGLGGRLPVPQGGQVKLLAAGGAPGGGGGGVRRGEWEGGRCEKEKGRSSSRGWKEG